MNNQVINIDGTMYIREDVYKKQLETMKSMYEQKDVGMIPVKDIKIGGAFLDSHGKKFLKVDHKSIYDFTSFVVSELHCVALSLKTHRVVMFSSNQPVRPIEGN